MASISSDKQGNRTIQFISVDGKRRSIRLGKMPKKTANEIKLKVESLNAAKLSCLPLDSETASWVARIGQELGEKLAAVGLIVQRSSATLEGFLRGYIEGRTDLKWRTRNNLEQTAALMVKFFGKDRSLRDITPADADAWSIELKRDYAEATVARSIKRARQFFKAAIRAKIVSESPFDGIKTGRMDNPDKFFYVTEEMTQKILEACPDTEWRLIVALARYGGLRCPSELLALTWGDIDWDRQRFLVRSSKLEHCANKGKRWVPLFPELRPLLEDHYDKAPAGTVYVINKSRSAEVNLRTQLERIILRAGLLPWPKLFQNMRSTRETELARDHPIHHVTQWIGNSIAIAAKHYLQVTDEDFERAVQGGAKSGAVVVQNPVQSGTAGNCQEVKEASQVLTEKDSRQLVTLPDISTHKHTIPLRGFEPLS